MDVNKGFRRALLALALSAAVATTARADVGYPGDRPGSGEPPAPPGLGPDTVPEPAPPPSRPSQPPARARGSGDDADTVYDERGRPVERGRDRDRAGRRETD